MNYSELCLEVVVIMLDAVQAQLWEGYDCRKQLRQRK